MSGKTVSEARSKRQKRIRGKISGTSERPRGSVFRSNKGIYAQVIDDVAGGTLAAMDAILNGEVAHAFHPGGGLHHASRDRASRVPARAPEWGNTP